MRKNANKILEDAHKAYAEQEKAYNEAEAAYKAAKARYDAMSPPFWGKIYVKAIAEAIIAHMPLKGYTYEISGPFGLDTEMFLAFRAPDAEKDEHGFYKNDGKSPILIFTNIWVNGEKEVAIKDYTKNTGRFAKDTVGEINGMNHPPIQVQWDATWLCRQLVEQNKDIFSDLQVKAAQ